jgi:hypothetical protein
MTIYYVYAYLRSKESSNPKISDIALKGTPYYIGKGSNGRAYHKGHAVPVPKDKSNIVILECNLSEKVSLYIEKFLIKCYGRIDIGTGILRNRTDGGEGISGAIRSRETKAKQSASIKGANHFLYGKTRSEDSKQKQSDSIKGKNHPLYGKHHSEESKAKISAANKGKYIGENNPWYGKTASEETRAKMSISFKNRPILECPHCGKQGKCGNMVRWHFDNCKMKL